MTLDMLLVSAVGGLCGAIGVLWRALVMARERADKDRREAARLLFALLGERAARRCEVPPVTNSTPAEPQYAEAKALAIDALNGDLERMVRDYLTEPSVPPRSR